MKISNYLKIIEKREYSQKTLDYFHTHIDRYQCTIKLIQNLHLAKKAKVLDIGCYPLHMYKILKFLGFQVYGISSLHEKVLKKNIVCLNIESDKLPYADNTFSLVICSEVIEHLQGDITLLFSEIYRILSENSYLLITTPNVSRSQNLFRLLFNKNIYFGVDELKNNIYNRHNREYTLSELKNILLANKFGIQNSGYFISYTPFRKKNIKDPFFLRLIKYLNYAYMNIFFYRKDTIYIVAKKNSCY